MTMNITSKAQLMLPGISLSSFLHYHIPRKYFQIPNIDIFIGQVFILVYSCVYDYRFSVDCGDAKAEKAKKKKKKTRKSKKKQRSRLWLEREKTF